MSPQFNLIHLAPFANASLPPNPHLQPSYSPSTHFASLHFALYPHPHAFGCSSILSASSFYPDSLRVLQWNAGGLRTRSTEILYFISCNPVDLICIQESNINSSSSFRIPNCSALRSDRTHSRSGILSPDDPHTSGGVIIFVRQGLSFSKLITYSLSSLDPYYDYVMVNILLNNSSTLSFLNVYAPFIRSFSTDSRSDSISPPFFLPSEITLFWGTLLPSPLLGLKRYF